MLTSNLSCLFYFEFATLQAFEQLEQSAEIEKRLFDFFPSLNSLQSLHEPKPELLY